MTDQNTLKPVLETPFNKVTRNGTHIIITDKNDLDAVVVLDIKEIDSIYKDIHTPIQINDKVEDILMRLRVRKAFRDYISLICISKPLTSFKGKIDVGYMETAALYPSETVDNVLPLLYNRVSGLTYTVIEE